MNSDGCAASAVREPFPGQFERTRLERRVFELGTVSKSSRTVAE